MLWHLLSLDAPTVAAVWTVFVAWCAGVRLSPADPAAMFVAVWTLYAADRLLDARSLAAEPFLPDIEERHRFHHRHRRWFAPAIIGACVPLALLVHRLAASVLHLYALLACLLAGWLLLVHAQPSTATGTARRLPKELAVGVFFSAAVFIPTVARSPMLRPALLPGALLFAGVCALNCLLLYAWEHPADQSRAHATTQWSLRRLSSLAMTLILVALALTAISFDRHRATAALGLRSLAHPWALSVACAASTALLLGLHAVRARLAGLHLRALADVVLLTPVLAVILVRFAR